MQYCEVSKERYQHNCVVDKEQKEAEEIWVSEEREKQDLILEEVQKLASENTLWGRLQGWFVERAREAARSTVEGEKRRHCTRLCGDIKKRLDWRVVGG